MHLARLNFTESTVIDDYLQLFLPHMQSQQIIAMMKNTVSNIITKHKGPKQYLHVGTLDFTEPNMTNHLPQPVGFAVLTTLQSIFACDHDLYHNIGA